MTENLCGATGEVRDMGYCYCTRPDGHDGDHACVHGQWEAW